MYDLAIVGGGLSGSLTLIYLLDGLLSPGCAAWDPAEFRVAWIDRAADFGLGFAYGHAAHSKFLLNNDVACMNVGGFHAWLSAHRARWQARLEQESDTAVQNWLRRHRYSLDAGASDPTLYLPMFLPRRVFGMFLSDWLSDSLERARRRGVTIELFPERACAVDREGGALHVTTGQGTRLTTRVLILAAGSLPPDPNPSVQHAQGYVHEWRMPDGGACLRETLESRNQGKGGPCGAIIIGSHAAAMESLYSIANDSTLTRLLHDICVISPSGRLPQAASSRRHDFRAQHLQQLLTASGISAENLISAALADLEFGERAGFTAADCSDAICTAFGKVFQPLSPEQKQRFVEKYGFRFTALNRHTPPDYADAAELLRQRGKLRTVTGKVVEIIAVDDHFEVVVGHPDEEQRRETISAEVVINCRGAGSLSRTDDPFLRSLLDSQNGIACLNRSGQGIAVSATFEASPGVFVVGPLLAGHSEGADHFWNLERAERIEELAQRTSATLAQRILQSREPDVVNG